MKNWLFLFLMIASVCATAQTFPYDFSVDQAPYETLTNGTRLFNGGPWDDNEDSIDLNFALEFFGEQSSRVYVSSDGILQIRFDNTQEVVLLFPYGGADLIDRGFYTLLRSNVWYQIDGDPGDRIFKIEWNNAGFFEDFSAQDSTNFQCWIYESDGLVEMRYGTSQVSDPGNYFYGNLGPFVGLAELDGDFESGFFWSLTGPVAVPSVAVTDISDYGYELPALFDLPADSTVYRFKYMSVSAPTVVPSTLDVQVLFDGGNLVIRSNETTSMRYQLMNASGQTVKQGIVESGFNQFQTADLSPGIYFIRLFDGHEKMKTDKLVKQ